MSDSDQQTLLRELAEARAELAEAYRRLYEAERERNAGLIPRVAAPGATHTPTTADCELIGKVRALTDKQRAVYFAILDRRTYAEIATLMKLSVVTVKLHLKTVRDKIGVSSLGDLKRVADQHIAAIQSVPTELVFGMPIDWTQQPSAELMAKLAPRSGRVPPPPGRKGRQTSGPVGGGNKVATPTRRQIVETAREAPRPAHLGTKTGTAVILGTRSKVK